MRLLTLVLLAGVFGSTLASNILALLTMPSRSHGILIERLLRELGQRGHHITYITASPPAQGPIPNMTLIHLPDIMEVMMRESSLEKDGKMDMFAMKDSSSWVMFMFTFASTVIIRTVLDIPEVQEIVQSKNQKYDLILAEVFLNEGLTAGFSHKFQAPIVGLMPFMTNVWGNYLTGNPSPSSYVPDAQLGFSSDMTFGQRLYNFIFTFAWDMHHPNIYLPLQDRIIKEYFGDDTPDIRETLRKTSAVLVNHHYALGFPRAYLPNMVEVAGMHINPVKELPQDLKKMLDDSKQGVVLFSMGSNLLSADIPPAKLQAILKAFQRLPYNVLWKFEAEPPNLPKNVQVSKWLPQSDILAHPNVKLFITHGGLLSTTEAVFRGVPVLGIPIFGDQPLNMKHTENAGLGKTIDYDELTEELLYSKIMEVTGNPSFAAAAKLKSRVLQDTMNTPLEKAVWWVEYVIRHNGASFLRSPAQNLSYIQLHQIDVLAFVGVSLLAVLYINLIIARAICRKLFCRNKVSEEAKKKKNVKKNN